MRSISFTDLAGLSSKDATTPRSHLATRFPTAPAFSSRMPSSITVTTGDAKTL